MDDFFQSVNGTLRVRYPFAPGSKRSGTSAEAAPSVSAAATLREKVLDVLKTRHATADEIAEILERSVLSVRPRCSELIRLGKIKETGERRKNESGKNAAVLTSVWKHPST